MNVDVGNSYLTQMLFDQENMEKVAWSFLWWMMLIVLTLSTIWLMKG